MLSKDLEKAINRSEIILSRSGYTTIMDLAKLEKKAIFIPTPGQFEQLYLAEKLAKTFTIPFCSQEKLKLKDLNFDDNYTGFSNKDYKTNFENLFSLF